jgi:hypothetical protein
VILFLDADDVLGKDTVRRVAEAFHRDSRLAGVHYRLRVIDESGRETSGVLPPTYLPLPCGDLSGNWTEVFNCASWPPTSGNAFSAWSLRRILPMPEEEFRVNADYYLTRVNALCGTVLALDEVGAYYRVHGANRHFTDRVDLDQIRRQVVLTAAARAHIGAFAHRQGSGDSVGTTLEDDDEIFLAQRLISCKLDSKNHPIAEDRSGVLWRRGLRAALRRSCLSFPVRAIHVLWFLGMGLLPRGMARPLAKQFFPPTRRRLNRALNVLQRQAKWSRRPVAR